MKTDAHWKIVGLKHHHGIGVPLSALHTKNSHGIGEFLDLIPLIDFCKQIGFDTIQLLPINDTGGNTSPYSILSSCALDPVYLSFSALGISSLELKKQNSCKRVAITEVKEKKLPFLYRYYKETKKDASYQKFIQKHQNWLIPYGQLKGDVDFYSFLQYLCFSQMEKVRAYATKQGVFLKGDIPILLSPDSVDVLTNPHLFNHDLVAGAPPDYYNKLGQKWGFPIFSLDAMRRENFAWWKQRLAVASSLYHIYRIDHVVGLFRIWAIPKDKEAMEGHFIPPDPHLWGGQGRELLEMMINASPLLPIAEDLGTIPNEVRHTLKEFGICGNKVIRWERRWHQDEKFIPFDEYEPFSLTTVSTHDSETLQMWWKNHPEEAKLLTEKKKWEYHPILSKEERFNLLYDAHHTPSYFHINLLQEYLAFFPELVAENPEDERINIPGTILETNWTYRYKPTIEEMGSFEPLIVIMKEVKKGRLLT